jgi:hypothetical protein
MYDINVSFMLQQMCVVAEDVLQHLDYVRIIESTYIRLTITTMGLQPINHKQDTNNHTR